ADRLLRCHPRELERAAAAVHEPPIAVAREERGVGRGVVVVEELEQVREPALLAAADLIASECDVALGRHRAVAAVRADEVVLAAHSVTEDSQAPKGIS